MESKSKLLILFSILFILIGSLFLFFTPTLKTSFSSSYSDLDSENINDLSLYSAHDEWGEEIEEDENPKTIRDKLKDPKYMWNLRHNDTFQIENNISFKTFKYLEKEIKFEKKNPLKTKIEMQLLTGYNYETYAGEDVKVAELLLLDWHSSRKVLFDDMRTFNIKRDYEEETPTREFTTKYLVENEVEVCYDAEEFGEAFCEDIIEEEWIVFDKMNKLPHRNITVGLFTDTTYKERIEWVPVIDGVNILEYASWEITAGTKLEFDMVEGRYNSLVKINDTSYLNVYSNNYDGYAVVLNVDGTTVINGSSHNFEIEQATYNSVIKINDTAYLNTYAGEGSDGYAIVLLVDGTTITNGSRFEFDTVQGVYNSLVKINDTAYLNTYAGEGDDGYAVVLNVDGTTITAGTKLEFDTLFGQFNSLVKINDTTYINTYTGNETDGYAIVLTVDGTTITNDTSFEFDEVNGYDNSLVKINDTAYLNTYAGEGSDGYAVILNVDGTTITNGSRLEFDTSYGRYHSLVNIDNETFINTYEGTTNTGQSVIINFDGAVLANETTFEFESTNNLDNSLVKIDNTKFLNTYTGVDNDGYAVVLTAETGDGLTDCNVIDSPGMYTLANDIVNSSTPLCMEITANDVTLDCQGHTIDGDDAADYGIYIYRASSENANVTIKNCVVTDWDARAIEIYYSSNVTIMDSVFDSNPVRSVYSTGSHELNITNVTSSNSQYGFQLGGNNIIMTDSIATDNQRGFYLNDIFNGVFENLILANNTISDFWLYTSIDANCNHRFVNVTGTDNKPILFYNETVNLQNWDNNVSQLILCGADNSVLNNLTFNSSITNTGVNYISLSDNVTISNITLIDRYFGFETQYLNSFSISDINADNCERGLNIQYNSNNGILEDIYCIGKNYCVFLSNGKDYEVNNMKSKDITYPLRLSSADNVFINNYTATGSSAISAWFTWGNNITVTNSTFAGSSSAGFRNYDSTNLLVYNNIFNSTTNLLWGPFVYDVDWNTTLQTKTNIISGNKFGGNYWTNPTATGFSDNCVDIAPPDGICDESYDVYNDATGCTSNNCDYLSLTGFAQYNLTTCQDIDNPGNYTLQANIDNQDGNCFVINSHNVIINGNGYYINGDDDSTGYGISSTGYDNIYVKDVNISDFREGVYFSSCDNPTVVDSVFNNNYYSGVYYYNSPGGLMENIFSTNNMYGVYDRGQGTTLNNIFAHDNTYYGIFVGYSGGGTNLSNSDLRNNTYYDFYVYSTNVNVCDIEFTNITGTDNKPITYYNEAVELRDWNNNVSEIVLCDADNSVLNNITLNHTDLQNNGILLVETEFTNITNIDLNNLYQGIHVLASDNNYVKNINANNNYRGLYLYLSSYNLLNNLIVTNSNYGISLNNGNNNSFSNLSAINSSSTGLYVFSTRDNYFKNINIEGSGSNQLRVTGHAYNNTLINVNTTGFTNILAIAGGITQPYYLNDLIYNNTYGTIQWTSQAFRQNFDFKEDLSMGENLDLEYNLAYFKAEDVDLTDSYINSSADITLRGLGMGVNRTILRNGIECNSTTSPACYNLTSLDLDEVKFNVTSWSNYSVGEELDSIAPNVTLLTPENGTITSNQTWNFTANITDEGGIKNATLYVYNSTGLYNSTVVTFVGGVTEALLGIQVFLVEGIYTWFFEVYDWAANLGTSESSGGESNFSIEVSIPTYFTFQANIPVGQNFTFQLDSAIMDIVWNDTYTQSYSGTGLVSHNFTTSGIHNISINGSASRISFYEGTPTLLYDILTNVSEGVTGITSGLYMFRDTIVSNFTEPAFFDDVSGDVTDMRFMFRECKFNQDLTGWNTSSVTTMRGMFNSADFFNSPLNDWDVSNVTNMESMFDDSFAFNQNLSNWNISSVTDFENMFDDSNLSVTNYDNLLIGWNNLPSLSINETIGVTGLEYCLGQSARQNIVDTYNWTFRGDSLNCALPPTQTTPILNSTLGTNLSSEDLTCYNQSTYDAEGDDVKNIYNWYKNNETITILNMPFEGGSNSTYAKDYSGNGFEGISVLANWNNSIGYDGKGAYNFNLSDNDNINTSWYPSPGNYTLMMWIKWDSLADYQAIGIHPGDPHRFYLGINGVNLYYGVGDAWTSSTTLHGMVTDTWYLFGMTTNGTDAVAYIDGVPMQTLSYSSWGTDTLPFMIGDLAGYGDTSVRDIQGTIDDLVIYNKTLSENQIQVLYQNRTNVIISDETTQGEVWECEITPNDGIEDGNASRSNNLTILGVDVPISNLTSCGPIHFNVTDGTWTLTTDLSCSDTQGIDWNSSFANMTWDGNGHWFNVSSGATNGFLGVDGVFGAGVGDFEGFVFKNTKMDIRPYSDFYRGSNANHVSGYTRIINNYFVDFSASNFRSEGDADIEISNNTFIGTTSRNSPFVNLRGDGTFLILKDNLFDFNTDDAVTSYIFSQFRYINVSNNNFTNLNNIDYFARYDDYGSTTSDYSIFEYNNINITGVEDYVFYQEDASPRNTRGIIDSNNFYGIDGGANNSKFYYNDEPYYNFTGTCDGNYFEWRVNDGECTDSNGDEICDEDGGNVTFFNDVRNNTMLCTESRYYPIGSSAPETGNFTFQVNTTSDYQNFTFRLVGATAKIYWNNTYVQEFSGTDLVSFNYATAGVHNISVSGIASRIAFDELGGTPELLHDILTNVSEGLSGINSAESMFAGTNVISFTNEQFFDDVSGSVTNMESMFENSQFNGNISGWDTSLVTNMVYTFFGSEFNQNISEWDTGSVTNMRYMFGSSEFNQNISNWDVSSVENLQGTFYDSEFNQDISDWNTSSLTSLYYTFYGSEFNQNISAWDVSSVDTFRSAFRESQFNQNISGWDTSSATNMYYMFYNSPFNQDIGSWNVSGVTLLTGMLSNSNLSVENYDNLLIGWNNLPSLSSNEIIGVDGLEYCEGESARLNINQTYNWFFSGDSLNCSEFQNNLTCWFDPVYQEDGIRDVWCNYTDSSNNPILNANISHSTYDTNDWYKNSLMDSKGWFIGYQAVPNAYNFSANNYTIYESRVIDSVKRGQIRYGDFTYPFEHLTQNFSILLKAGAEATTLRVMICNDTYYKDITDNTPINLSRTSLYDGCQLAGTINATEQGIDSSEWSWGTVDVTSAYNNMTSNQNGLQGYSVHLSSYDEFEINPVGWEISDQWMSPYHTQTLEVFSFLNNSYNSTESFFYPDNRTHDNTTAWETKNVLNVSTTITFNETTKFPIFNSDDDYLEPLNYSSYEAIRNSSFSTCMFFKRSETSSDLRRLIRWDGAYELSIQSDDITMVLRARAPYYKVTIKSTGDLVDDTEWHHVCGIRDKENEEIKIILDGEMVKNAYFNGSRELSATDFDISDNANVIGRDTPAGGNDNGFRGQLAHYFLHNDSHTAGEIKEGINTAWWSLATGEQVTDSVYATGELINSTTYEWDDEPGHTPIAFTKIYNINNDSAKMIYNVTNELYHYNYYTNPSQFATSQGSEGVNFTTLFETDEDINDTQYWYVKGSSNATCEISVEWNDPSKTGQYQLARVNWTINSTIPLNERNMYLCEEGYSSLSECDIYTGDSPTRHKRFTDYGTATVVCEVQNDYMTEPYYANDTLDIGCWSAYDKYDGTEPSLELESNLTVCVGNHTMISMLDDSVIKNSGEYSMSLSGATIFDGGGQVGNHSTEADYRMMLWGYDLTNKQQNPNGNLIIQNGDVGFFFDGNLADSYFMNYKFNNMSIAFDLEHISATNFSIINNTFTGCGVGGEDSIYVTGPNVNIQHNYFNNLSSDGDVNVYCDGCTNVTLEQNIYWDINNLNIYSLGNNRTVNTTGGSFTCEVGEVGVQYPYMNFSNITGDYLNEASLFGSLTDYYPCTDRDPTILEINLTAPENNTITSVNAQNFTVNITDDTEIKNVTLYIYNESDLYNSTVVNFTGGITQTLIGIQVYLVEGIYNWFYGVYNWNDDYGTSENYTITVDNTIPGITILFPNDGGFYGTDVSGINYSFSDPHPGSCWYSTDLGITNSSSVSAGTNFTGIASVEGSNTWIVYCNDSVGNLNQSSTTFTKETTPPYFTYIPANTTIQYGEGFGVDFNATDTVMLDSYAINWTTNFQINQSGWLENTTRLGVGLYLINVTINDSANNLNSTIYQVNVTPINSQTLLVFDKTSPQTYGTTIKASCSVVVGEGTPILYREGVDVTVAENGQNVLLGAGTYNYECNLSETQNYTASTNQESFTIGKTSSDVATYIDGLRTNRITDNATENNLTSVLVTGQGDIQLYVNGSLWNTGVSPLENITFFNAGVYPILTNYTGNENYTASSEQWTLTIKLPYASNCSGLPDYLRFMQSQDQGKPHVQLCYVRSFV